jgi:hypothetical protein
VTGKFQSVGDKGAFSPALEITVYDQSGSGQPLLAKETARPVGYFLKDMPPGASAAFEAMLRIPGDHSQITWNTAANYPGDIKTPKK